MNLSRKLVFKLDSILNDRPERLCERADTVTLSGHSSRLQLCGRGASLTHRAFGAALNAAPARRNVNPQPKINHNFANVRGRSTRP